MFLAESWSLGDTYQFGMTIIGTIAALATVAGIFWWLLGPRVKEWAHKEILDPVKRVDHQVSVNNHVSAKPTLLDKVDTIQVSLQDTTNKVNTHLRNSQKFVGSTNYRLTHVEDTLRSLNHTIEELPRGKCRCIGPEI